MGEKNSLKEHAREEEEMRRDATRDAENWKCTIRKMNIMERDMESTTCNKKTGKSKERTNQESQEKNCCTITNHMRRFSMLRISVCNAWYIAKPNDADAKPCMGRKICKM